MISRASPENKGLDKNGIMGKYAIKRSEEKARDYEFVKKNKTNTQVSIYFYCFPCNQLDLMKKWVIK